MGLGRQNPLQHNNFAGAGSLRPPGAGGAMRDENRAYRDFPAKRRQMHRRLRRMRYATSFCKLSVGYPNEIVVDRHRENHRDIAGRIRTGAFA